MAYSVFLLKNPLFWVILGGAFLGAALAQLTVIPSRTRDPVKTRRRKPTKIFLLLAAAVPSFTVASILSLPETPGVLLIPHDLRTVLVALTAVLLAGLGLRFKKTAGILLLVLIGLTGFGARAALQGWTAVHSPEDLGRIKILHRGEGETSLLVDFMGQGERVFNLPAERISILVDFLILDDAYVLLGRKTSYRILALQGGGMEEPLGTHPPGEPGPVQSLFYRFPGVRVRRMEAELAQGELFSTYQIWIEPGDELPLRIR